jgi:hypothetical protein
LDKKKVNNFEKDTELNMGQQVPLSKIQFILEESVKMIKSTKKKSKQENIIQLTESKLNDIKVIDCSDSTFGAYSLLESFKEYISLSESIDEENTTDTPSINVDGNIDITGNLSKGQSSSSSMTNISPPSGSIYTESDEGTQAEQDIVESAKKEKDLEESKKQLEESLKLVKNLQNKLKVTVKKLEESKNKNVKLQDYYDKMSVSVNTNKQNLINESMKFANLKSFQDTRIRELKESNNERDRKISTLIEHNVKLMEENKRLSKVGMATRIVAEKLADQVLKK